MSIKLEFIADVYEGGPLLLLWGGVADDVSGLIRTFVSLSNRVGDRVSLHELPFIEAQPYVSVIAISGERSSGVLTRNGTLEWQQSTSDWDNAAGLLGPFADDAHGGGFQHLNMSDGAEVIYSTRRAW